MKTLVLGSLIILSLGSFAKAQDGSAHSSLDQFVGNYILVSGPTREMGPAPCDDKYSITSKDQTLFTTSIYENADAGITLGATQSGDASQWTTFKAQVKDSELKYITNWGAKCKTAFVTEGCQFSGFNRGSLKVGSNGELTEMSQVRTFGQSSTPTVCVYKREPVSYEFSTKDGFCHDQSTKVVVDIAHCTNEGLDR
jgi:hypothetical protein